MKINVESVSEASEPIQLFYSGCKSPATKDKYTQSLKRVIFEFMEDILTCDTFESRANEIVTRAREDPKWITSVLIAIVDALKKKTELPSNDPDFLKTSCFDNYIPPMKKLLDMNDVPVVWKKIYSMYPENHSDEETRGYSRAEIRQMLKIANAQDSASILIASSSGIRLGAFDFRWKHIKPVYEIDGNYIWEDQDITESVTKDGKVVCGLIVIYSDSEHRQFGFITPEALDAIQAYRTSWIQQIGKEPQPEQPFLKQEGIFVKPLHIKSLWSHIRKIVVSAGLRDPLVKGKRRHEIPLMNGFRRFFNRTNKESISKDSVLAQLIKKEVMMGHTGLISLDKNYFKLHMSELVEEYLNAVPDLTISDEFRLQAENAKLKENESNQKSSETINSLWENIAELQFEVKALRASAQTRYDDELKERIKSLKDNLR
ncbi:MAG: integrase [Nitrosarchaeum sp.]|nr:integrase [Nitrosarchaeum sp.]